MRRAILVVAFLIVGCRSAGEKAEKEYQFLVENHASASDLCDKAKQVADAYASEQQSEKYSTWSGRASMTCLNASISRGTL